MDSRKIETFIAVAELQNISAAAEKLHISHQGVSQQIKSLENELGIVLFERSTNKISITSVGKKTYEIFKPIMESFNAGTDELSAFIQHHKKKFSIAYFTGIGYSKTIKPLIDDIVSRSSDTEIELISGSIRSCISLTKSNSVDAAIIPVQIGERIEGLSSVILRRVPMSILISTVHPWASRESISALDLEDASMLVYDNRRDGFASPFMSNIKVKEIIYVDSFDNYVLRLTKGDCFGINFQDYSMREWEFKLLDLPDCYKTDMDIVAVFKQTNIHANTLSRIEPIE